MSIVSLVSGGMDSTLMSLLTMEEGIEQFPLFIDYGQLNRDRELNACVSNFERLGLPDPEVLRISSFGALISSGLTDSSKRVYEDAFLPCRNLMFLTVGAAYACQCGATAVAIGLLDDGRSLFPDQTQAFILETEALVSRCLDKRMRILTPLMTFSKADIVRIARLKKIEGTYSCHAGTASPCGVCIACREYNHQEE